MTTGASRPWNLSTVPTLNPAWPLAASALWMALLRLVAEGARRERTASPVRRRDRPLAGELAVFGGRRHGSDSAGQNSAVYRPYTEAGRVVRGDGLQAFCQLPPAR